PDHAVAQVLGDLQGQRPLAAGQLHVHVQGPVDVGHRVPGELHVDDRADDAYDPTGTCPGLHSSSHHSSLPAAARALAPPTISLISWVISACRTEFISRVRVRSISSALSVALFIARRRAADSLAAASMRAA